MRVDRIHPARLSEMEEDLGAAVVIDVLRATSTAIALFTSGAHRVEVVATPGELRSLPAPPGASRYLVFSELDESRAAGLECLDNSPALAAEVSLVGRLPVLVTTNGTRALAAAVPRARDVLVASFGNLTAVAHHLAASAEHVTLLPAGDFAGGEPRTEDELCADALADLLAGRSPDLPALIEAVWQDARVQRRIARHPELVRDVEIALAVDRHPAVPRLAADPGSRGLALVPADRAGG